MNWKLPNQLTIGRLGLGIVFFILLACSDAPPNPSSGLLLACFIIYLIAGATDVLDGHLARKMNLTSAFGRIADPFADKMMVLGGFALLAGSNFAYPGGVPTTAFERGLPAWLHGGMASGVQAWMLVVMIGREFAVSSIRGFSESLGLTFAATPAGKIKMFIQSTAICTVMFQMAYLTDTPWAIVLRIALVWLTVLVTFLSGLAYIGRARHALAASGD